MRQLRFMSTLAATSALALGVAACGGGDDEGASGTTAEGEATEQVSGDIRIDGSSTVFPSAQAASELFNEENPDVNFSVGLSGTGGGFEKFCAGETDISDASRPIDEEEEAPVCEENNIGYEQIAVANDGIAVVTNPELGVECLTVEQLNELWAPDSDVDQLSDLDPQLPDTELTLFGPGTDSGTFDFFTEVINDEGGASRTDYEASEDDNQLVTGVSGSPGGIGYFGYSYYEQNQDKLNLVAIDSGDGCVTPSTETIQDGSYAPLGRPIFMYPSDRALERPEVAAFMDFVIENNQAIAEAANVIPLTEEQAAEAAEKISSLAGA
jgi:phosphate transport system substrate-binding protein